MTQFHSETTVRPHVLSQEKPGTQMTSIFEGFSPPQKQSLFQPKPRIPTTSNERFNAQGLRHNRREPGVVFVKENLKNKNKKHQHQVRMTTDVMFSWINFYLQQDITIVYIIFSYETSSKCLWDTYGESKVDVRYAF